MASLSIISTVLGSGGRRDTTKKESKKFGRIENNATFAPAIDKRVEVKQSEKTDQLFDEFKVNGRFIRRFWSKSNIFTLPECKFPLGDLGV